MLGHALAHKFYRGQFGQRGSGIKVYKGWYLQCGSGLGGILKMVLPFLKSAGTSVLKMGKKILPGLVSDVVAGKRKCSESLKHRGTAALMDALEEREEPRPPKTCKVVPTTTTSNQKQQRYLLDGVPMKLELLRSPDEFFFMCAADGVYKLALPKAEFYVRQLNIDPAVRETHVSSLNAGVTAKYPLSRVQVTAHDIPTGSRDFHKDQLIGGQLPKHVVLGLVDNSAYVGSKEKNPYNFKHNHVTMIKLKLNGQEVHGMEMKSDFSNNSANLKQIYMNLFRNTGQLWRPETCEVSVKAFAQGYTLWVVDLKPDLGADEGISYPRHNGKFGQALENPVTLICYEEYENVLEIDRFRNAMMV
ncbi:uncharacterized protein F54H12.2-like [Haliotis rufescens]|uniref:uncharacterized protein F54H12.2-like n=1 Tax=Haliotis rufescens TaxID=6454 RepID=UPI00201FA4E6|nr:uncharacterized protein F54H12.2-like [Haliotis rufescens]